MPDLEYPSTIYVPDPVNELYFNGIGDADADDYITRIMKWSKVTGSLTDIASNLPIASSLKDHDFICDRERNRILLFGGSIFREQPADEESESVWELPIDDIWSYCLNEEIWTKLAVKLPMKKGLSIVHGFPSVVIALHTDDDTKVTDIWCLELKSLQWFKSEMRMPLEYIGGSDLVVTDDHFLHCLSYSGPAYHLRFDLRDMLPKELFTANLEKNMEVISGYCRTVIVKHLDAYIPEDVKHLIACYFNALFWKEVMCLSLQLRLKKQNKLVSKTVR